jgi:hypothetical protein
MQEQDAGAGCRSRMQKILRQSCSCMLLLLLFVCPAPVCLSCSYLFVLLLAQSSNVTFLQS